MTSVNAAIDIPAAPGRVFDVLVEPARFEEWNPVHESWPHGTPEVARGETFVQRTSFMGRSADVTWTVTELDAPSAIELSGQGPMGMTMRSEYLLAPRGDGTRLELRSEVEGTPRALRGVARRRAQAIADESLSNLCAVVADGGRPAPVAAPAERSRPSAVARVVGGTRDAVALGAGIVLPSSVRRAGRRVISALR